MGLFIALVLGQPRPLLLRLDDRRELQSRLPGSADQPLLRQPGRHAAGPCRFAAGNGLGSLLLCVALVGRLVTIPLPIPFLGDVAFLIGLAGLFTLLCGTAALKRYWFAFFFLIFMVPLPIALYSKIASPLQLLASRVASTVMNATGVPVLCEGNKMTLPGGLQMFVAEACSGMRQLTGFLALTTAVAYLTTRPVWYRVIIMVSALPIALSANIARVMLTGYIMHFVNPQFALGTYHTLEGLLMMGFGLLLLHCECWVLDQIVQACRRAEAGAARKPTRPRRGRWRSARPERDGPRLGLARPRRHRRRAQRG